MQLLSVRLCLSIAAVEDQGTSNQWCVEWFQCNNRKNCFLSFPYCFVKQFGSKFNVSFFLTKQSYFH